MSSCVSQFVHLVASHRTKSQICLSHLNTANRAFGCSHASWMCICLHVCLDLIYLHVPRYGNAIRDTYHAELPFSTTLNEISL